MESRRAPLRQLWARRLAAWDEFDAWRPPAGHLPGPTEALGAAGWLFDLLPPASRHRPPDTRGIVEMHRCLGVLQLNRR